MTTGTDTGITAAATTTTAATTFVAQIRLRANGSVPTNLAGMAASSNRLLSPSPDGRPRISDAAQLGDRAGERKVCRIMIGSFNVGVYQNMLDGNLSERYLRKVEHIIATCVKEVGLDIMNLCEFGGHKKGLHAVVPPIHPRTMHIFASATSPSPAVSVNNNYLTAWAFHGDASQFAADRAVTDCCRSFHLHCDKCEPEMIVHKFRNAAGITVLQGNLNIRTPQSTTVTKAKRKRLLNEALTTLEAHAPRDRATRPVVKVLVGDCNLTKADAEEAIHVLQPTTSHWRTVWQVHATSFGLSGDLIFVKGAHARSFDLPFGQHHIDRGVRNDSHDAIGIELRAFVEIHEAGGDPEVASPPADLPAPASAAATSAPATAAAEAMISPMYSQPLAVGDRVRACRDLADGDISRGRTGRVMELHTDGTVKFDFGDDKEGWFSPADVERIRAVEPRQTEIRVETSPRPLAVGDRVLHCALPCTSFAHFRVRNFPCSDPAQVAALD